MSESTPPSGHPLTKTQHQSAFTIAALFWGVGVAMIDPRMGVGILLCAIGIAGTLWLYWSDLLRTRSQSWRAWPWLGIVVIIIEIVIPCWLLVSKSWGATEAEKRPIVALPSVLTPIQPTPGTASTYMQMYYRCKTASLTQRDMEKLSANFKRYMAVTAETFGYKANFVQVMDGDKVVLTPDTPHRKRRLWFLNTMSFEIRRIGKTLVGVSTRDFIDNFVIQYFASLRIPPTNPIQIETKGVIEELAGVKKGDCELQ